MKRLSLIAVGIVLVSTANSVSAETADAICARVPTDHNFKQCVAVAEKASPKYQNLVGDWYFFGREDAKGGSVRSEDAAQPNLEQAVYWWTKAANNGDAEAARFMCSVYQIGDKGVPKNYAEAYRYCRIAASTGPGFTAAFTAREVYRMYSIGQGVTADRARSYAWLLLAQALDRKSANETQDSFDKRSDDYRATVIGAERSLSAEQTNQGQAIAKRCIDTKMKDCE